MLKWSRQQRQSCDFMTHECECKFDDIAGNLDKFDITV